MVHGRGRALSATTSSATPPPPSACSGATARTRAGRRRGSRSRTTCSTTSMARLGRERRLPADRRRPVGCRRGAQHRAPVGQRPVRLWWHFEPAGRRSRLRVHRQPRAPQRLWRARQRPRGGQRYAQRVLPGRRVREERDCLADRPASTRPDNCFPSPASFDRYFADAAGGDFHLLVANVSHDGTVPAGADIDEVNRAWQAAQAGSWRDSRAAQTRAREAPTDKGKGGRGNKRDAPRVSEPCGRPMLIRREPPIPSSDITDRAALRAPARIPAGGRPCRRRPGRGIRLLPRSSARQAQADRPPRRRRHSKGPVRHDRAADALRGGDHLQQLLRVRHRQGVARRSTPDRCGPGPWTVEVDGECAKPGRLSARGPRSSRTRSRSASTGCAASRLVDGDPVGRVSARRPAQARRADVAGEVRRVHDAARPEADAGAAQRRCSTGRTSKGCGWTRRCTR